MSKLYKSLVVLFVLSGILASCGGKLEDTYVLATLKQACGNDLVSVGFKYSFDSPSFIGAAKSIALVREGNQIEFFIGQDIQDKVKDLQGKKYTVAARKYFTPYIHFVVDYIMVGADTIQVGDPSEVKLPNLRPMAGFTAPEEYETLDLGKITPNLATLNDIKDKKFKVAGAKITLEQVPESGATVPYYSVNLRNVRFFVDEQSDAMLAILDAIMNEGKTFEGGVSYETNPTSLSKDYRERFRSGGKVKIGYMVFGGNSVTAAM